MARKVYAISNINGGIGNDKNFCKPWQVADCENIDLIADSNSLRLAWESEPSILNERWEKWKIIWKTKDYFLAKDGKYDSASLYWERDFKKGRNPEDLNYTIFALPSQTTKVIWGNHDDLRENSGTWETSVRWCVNITNKSQYFDLEYHVIATNSFLHLVKNETIPNTIPWNIKNWDWSWSWWSFSWNSYKNQEENTSPITRTFTNIVSCFQWQFAFRNWTKGTVNLMMTYQWEEHKKSWSSWYITTKNKTFSRKYSSDRDMLINAVSIEWWKSWNLVITLTPSDGFDGELFYNGLYDLGDLTQNPVYFQELYGIRTNYQKIKPSEKHPMIILGNILYVWCDDVIKVFTIDPYQENQNWNIQLIESEDILLPSGMKVVSLSQYGDRLTIYANSINDAYQMISSWANDGIESRIIRKWVQFMEVCNDWSQDFVAITVNWSYKIYLVSWGNKQQLYSSKRIYENWNLKPQDEYLFAFDWDSSFATMERFWLSRKKGGFYLMESTKSGRGLVKYSINQEAKISLMIDNWINQIDYFYTEDSLNCMQSLKFDWEYLILKDGYFTLPTLSTNYEDAQLESISFGSYLPNKEGKIEIWAMINEKDYFTFYVKNAEGKDFSKCKIISSKWGRNMELIDQNLINWEWYLSFRSIGNIDQERDFGKIGIESLDWEELLVQKDIISYDHYIKVEEITRENQKMWTREIGYNSEISVKKINNKIWTFGKISLKFKMSAWWTQESPRVYAPILLYYVV